MARAKECDRYKKLPRTYQLLPKDITKIRGDSEVIDRYNEERYQIRF